LSTTDKTVTTREKILRAAEEILIAHSFSAITHRSVANMAGVPLGSTTYHFNDKPELINEVMRNILEAEIERRSRINVVATPNHEQVGDYLIELFVPTDFQNRHRLAVLYERLLEARNIEGLQPMVAQDQSHLVETVNRQFSIWGFEPFAGAAMAIVEGRAVQWLNQESDFEQLKLSIREDLALLLPKQG
jgi:DNA-binding transcriptional regulator YbjK